MSSVRMGLRKRLTFANCVALIALFVALGGVALAALPRNSVVSKTIKDSSITSRDIKNSAVNGVDIRDGNLTSADYGAQTVQGVDVKNNTLTGTQIDEDSIGVHRIAMKSVAATDGADDATARAAAPETTIATKTPFTVVGKCLRNTGTDTVRAELYIKTTASGSIFESNNGAKRGGVTAADFLQTDTAEADRMMEDATAANDTASLSADDNAEFSAIAPDGTHLSGNLYVGVRNGAAVPAGTVFGTSEHGCIFGGTVLS